MFTIPDTEAALVAISAGIVAAAAALAWYARWSLFRKWPEHDRRRRRGDRRYRHRRRLDRRQR